MQRPFWINTNYVRTSLYKKKQCFKKNYNQVFEILEKSTWLNLIESIYSPSIWFGLDFVINLLLQKKKKTTMLNLTEVHIAMSKHCIG